VSAEAIPGDVFHSTIHSLNLKRRNHTEELGEEGKIILEWILGK
jgi:hypothetical protein